jgi:hypothetical protein
METASSRVVSVWGWRADPLAAMLLDLVSRPNNPDYCISINTVAACRYNAVNGLSG